MDIKSQEWNSAYAKLTLKRVQNLKVQMEELQWGFPIATNLSLNKPLVINGKKKEEKEKGAGRAPADLHPPLNKKRWA